MTGGVGKAPDAFGVGGTGVRRREGVRTYHGERVDWLGGRGGGRGGWRGQGEREMKLCWEEGGVG